MSLRTEHLDRCIQTLEMSVAQLRKAPLGSIEYEVFRNAVVKGFELTLETAGKLLRKALKSYMANPRAVDALPYKDVLRQAAKHGLLASETVERWFDYRDNRNITAHDYGEGFAEETLGLMANFLNDAHLLATTLKQKLSHADA